jgi:hypothetical protein
MIQIPRKEKEVRFKGMQLRVNYGMMKASKKIFQSRQMVKSKK